MFIIRERIDILKMHGMPQLIPGTGSSSNQSDESPSDSAGTSVLTQPDQKTERPPLYKVLLINDDYTPMEFVVVILESIFNLSRERAISLMLAVHHTGIGVAGVYTHEVAETKAKQVLDLARKNEHPLMCRIERD